MTTINPLTQVSHKMLHVDIKLTMKYKRTTNVIHTKADVTFRIIRNEKK